MHEFQSYNLETGKAAKNLVQNSHWPKGVVHHKEILEKEVTDATNTEPIDCTLPVHTDTCINWDDLCNTFLKPHTTGSLTDVPSLNAAPLVHDIKFDLDPVALSELPDNAVQQILTIMTTIDVNCCPQSISIAFIVW